MLDQNNIPEEDIPLDVKNTWNNVSRRMQSVAKSEGLSVVEIRVLCDKDGNPIAWTEPIQTIIEPKRSESAFLLLTIQGKI